MAENNIPATSRQQDKMPPVRLSPLVRWGYKYHGVVILLVCALAIFGIYALTVMDKNEFPDFTIREGVLVSVYPGATAKEMEEQVMRPMEDFIFSYKEVNKKKTRSNATDGMVMTFIELDDNVSDADAFWTKFNMGIPEMRRSLPTGVLGVRLISNFGETSAILLTMQSNEKTYRELKDYMDELKDRLRVIPNVGTLSVTGTRNEQISITIDPEKLSKYAIDEKVIASTLFAQGFKTTGGSIRSNVYTSPIFIEKSLNSVREIQEMIIMSLPTGQTVRLRDVADVRRKYAAPDSYITNNGEKCLLLSIEMKKGYNIVAMGEEVEKQLKEFEETLPDNVTLYKITDQPKVVNDSVWDFMRELIIAIVAVVIAILLLLPLRVALIAASTIPITVFVSLGFFYLFGFELNTVTLACLIVSLGMIVDNSVVIIDDYVDLLAQGMNPKEATVRSASEFFRSIFSATLAISVTFFPFLITVTGMFGDFLKDFPWAISIILIGSFFIAELVVPFLQYYFIKPAKAAGMYKQSGGKKHFSFLGFLQGSYDKLITWCFRYPVWLGVIVAILTVSGTYLLVAQPLRMMPIAERDQFAVEIYLPTGTAIERTSQIADSLEAILAKDDRVVSIANFHGCSSPRFQTTYAPQVGGPNFAQFIVNTTSNQATEEVLHEYTPKYEDYFPGAVVRFKQLSYSNAAYPVELKISGSDISRLQYVSDTLMAIMRRNPDLTIVRSSLGTPSMGTLVKPDPVDMTRFGLTTGNLELDLASRYSKAIPVGTVWDGTYATDVVLKTTESTQSDASGLGHDLIPTGLLSHVTLDQIADVIPLAGHGQLSHLHGIKTVYIMAEVPYDKNVMDVTLALKEQIKKLSLPENVKIDYGGEMESTYEVLPQIGGALLLAVGIIFIILLFHYKNVRLTLMLLFSIVFCLPGAGFGLWLAGIPISITCVLGLISLMGILVRNVIIMIDYAEELHNSDGLSVKDAIYESAKRRMRPIFLTSAAASMGVIPMVIGKSPLWMPMGAVIFWGTIISMFFILTIIPVLYWRTQNVKKAE